MKKIPWLVVILCVIILSAAIWQRASAGNAYEPSQPPRLYTESMLRDLLVNSPWPYGAYDDVVQVAQCESGLAPTSYMNTQAVGDYGRAFGLLQINIDWHPWAEQFDLKDPRVNLLVGYAIWSQANRSFIWWSCYS